MNRAGTVAEGGGLTGTEASSLTVRQPLVDDAARRSIGNDLGATLFVEAGAGSGKTSTLVDRIVALIATGKALITGVAAITFTEAAAAELRIRVRRRLEEKAASAATLPDQQRRCAEALGHIDEAPISTIHGFCQRILAAHPIEAGLPPRFEVLDEVSESIEWQRRWSGELDLLATNDEMATLLSIGWVLDVNEKRVEALARAVDEQWHRCRRAGPDLREILHETERRTTQGIAEIQELVGRAVAERHRCDVADDRLLVRLGQLADHADRLGSARTWSESLPLLIADASLFSGGKALGQNQAWGGDADSVRDLVESVAVAYRGLIQGLVDLVVGALAQYFEARSHEAATARRHRGFLTFHDLLVLTRDLLRDHHGVLVAVRSRVSYLLIDEFQDTNRLQLEIARLIGSERGEWVAGKCFFVGDPKQSIYRFRGADLMAYEAARDEIVGPATTLLTSNFRSVPGIIDFVNACFAPLLGESFQALTAVRAQPASAAGELSPGELPPRQLSPGELPPGESLPVSVIGGEIPGKPLRREQRRIESEDCCRAIELAVSGEQWTVEDPVTCIARAARLGDVAILVPRRTGLAELEAALDGHDIGYRVESASLIFKSQEVRDVLALARAIDEPGDQAALVATLRSPAYSIGDDELVRWATAKGSWSIERAPEPAATEAAPRIAAALADLAWLRSRLGELGPVGALAHAVRERRLLQMASDRPHTREAWRRIRYLLDRARVFVDASGGGLAEFADWIDGQVQGGLRSSESVVPDADEDVVRIMTVHGAKGLEFPITILCGFGTSDEVSGEYDTILRQPGGGTEVHFLKTLRTAGYDVLDAEERVREAEEAIRLLYVAATRARDHLIICGHHVSNGKLTLGERLLEAASRVPGIWRLLPVRTDDVGMASDTAVATGAAGTAAAPAPTVPGTASVPSSPAIASITTLEDYDAWCSARARAIRLATRQANVRATELTALALAHPSGTPGQPDTAAQQDDTPTDMMIDGPSEASLDEDNVLPLAIGRRHRGRAGTQIGRAVHATLQSISLADAVTLGDAAPLERGRAASRANAETVPDAAHRLQAIADTQARAERVGDKAREVGRLARAALTSPVVRAAFASGTARRETYVAAPIGGAGGIVVDGYVDLCYAQPDGALVVIDYKTDSVRNPTEMSERADHYELQAAAYALALGEATGRTVSKCVLVFVSPPAEPLEHELSGTELTARIAAVREIAGALSS